MLIKSSDIKEYPIPIKIINKNIIILNRITFADIIVFGPYINLILQLNSLFLINYFNQCCNSIKTYFMNQEATEDWITPIRSIQEINREKLNVFIPQYEGGKSKVTLDSDFIKDIKEHILELPFITIIEEENSIKEFSYVENLISEIKDEVKKGNRVSFKLIEELKATIEALMSHSPNEKEQIDLLVTQYKNKSDDFLKLAIDALDMFDVILESAKKINLTDWTNHIQEVINNFLKTLDSFGIEEIKTLGLIFDAKTMESIGTVPQEFAPNLKQYQVYSVHRRGFRLKESGKVIREAKVSTII
jgi:molecular chaperone GrpE (heat shock protein)